MATWSQPESVVITLRETYSICGYTRISVDLEEDRDNTSIENQKAIIEDYVRRTFPGSTLDLYVDRDRSGYTFEQREQYQAMRRKMLRQQYDILIVKDLSRFSRRNGHGLVELETLRDAGIRIIAIGDNIDYPTNDDWMRIQIYFFMNEMPVTDTSKKVRNVIKRRQEDGKWICAVPYGYYFTNTKTMSFAVDPAAADIVRTIFRLYNEGWGYMRIANWLTEQRFPTPRKTEIARIEARGEGTKRKAKDAWSIATVQGILDNDFYIGTLRQGKVTRKKINGAEVKRDEAEHVVFEKNHESIVDDRTFALTRELRRQRTRSNYRGIRKNDNVYSGFLFCGDCGSPMFAMSRSDLRPAYTCGAYHRRGRNACSSHHIRVDVLDEIVKSYIRRIRDESEGMIKYLQESIREEESVLDESDDVIESLEDQLAGLQAELKATKAQKVRDRMRHPEDADIIDETYEAMEKDLTDRIAGIKNQILMSADKRSTVVTANRIARTVIEVFDSILEGNKFSKDDLRLILDRILVYEDRVEVQFKPDINAILQSGRMLTEKDAEALEILQSAEKHRTKALAVTDSAAEGAESPNIIRCGDPLEIFTEKDGELIFKKYSPIGELSDFAAELCDSLRKATDGIAAICDRDSVIAVSGGARKELLEKPVSSQLGEIMAGRSAYRHSSGGSSLPVSGAEDKYCLSVAVPVIAEGDVMGCVMFLTPRGSAPSGESEQKLAQAVALFLGRQMEG